MIKYYDLATGEAIVDPVADTVTEPVESTMDTEPRLMTIDEAVVLEQASLAGEPPALPVCDIEDIEQFITRQH